MRLVVWLRIGIFLSLVLLFISMNYIPVNHCGTCEFSLEGEEIDAGHFMADYFEECINPYVKKDVDVSKINITVVEGLD